MEITADMRDEFFEKNGYMGCDDVVEAWHKRELEKDSMPEAMNCMECGKEVIGESLCDECQIKHRNNYPELMKKLYESEPDKWVVYLNKYKDNSGEWYKLDLSRYQVDFSKVKLILKEHEHIATKLLLS